MPDFWLPLSLEPLVHADDNWLRDRENQRYRLFGRLASGVSISQAQAEMTIVADHLRTLHDPHSEAAKPATALVWPGSPFPLPLKMYPGLILTILLIMVAAGMVLVVACANVGSLQLARARSRQHELHTRLSLGASRLRIDQATADGKRSAGSAGGRRWRCCSPGRSTRLLATLSPKPCPPRMVRVIFDVTPDLEIFVYVLAVSLIAGILFGLAPALESSRSALSSGVRGSTSPVRSRRIQDFLSPRKFRFRWCS